MVYFEDNFWGEKNNGYDVLYHAMKHSIHASRELADFVRERATVEENYAKSLNKMIKPNHNGMSLGTFEPCWKTIKTSNEMFANSFSHAVQELHDLVKKIREYGEQQKETQKALKDELAATADVVAAIRTKTDAVMKAKDSYYAKCNEFERVKKETTNAKDIEKAEQKKFRAGEEYKSLIDKREEARKSFHARMIETAKKFEELESNHLKIMSEHLLSFIGTLESGQEAVQKVITHFRTQVKELTTNKLLEQFVKEKTTGRNVPIEIFFEEYAATGSLVDVAVEESPNIKIRKKKKEKDKDKEKDKEKESKDKRERKTKKKKEKEKTQVPNGAIETSPDANKVSSLPGNQDGVEVDEEGYSIIPKDTESHKSAESTDSDSDDDDQTKKIKITIKPATEITTASLDEFRSIQLSLPVPPHKKNESTSSENEASKTTLNGSGGQSSVKLSKSQEDLLSIDFSQASVFNTNKETLLSPVASNFGLGFDAEKENNEDQPPDLAPKKKLTMNDRSYSHELSSSLPPKKSSSTVFGSVGSLTELSPSGKDKEVESKLSPPESITFLAPPSEIPRSTSASNMGRTGSRPRPKPRLSATSADISSASLSLKTSTDPIRTHASPTPTVTTTETTTSSNLSVDPNKRIKSTGSDDGVGSSKTIWDRINSPSSQRAARGSGSPLISTRNTGILQPTVMSTVAGQAMKKSEEIIPVAVALVETVNAQFKGNDMFRHNITGDVTVSFPASAVHYLSSSEDPPMLTFALTCSNLLGNIFPNKGLIESDEPPADRNAKYFKFKMEALIAHLKKQSEQGSAPYYNIDILKYQVQQDNALTPLALSCFWKCEERTTDIKIDYQYSPSCLSVASPLNNVSFIVPVNGGVEIMQSKPVAKWSKDHNKALWQIQELSNSSDGNGSGSLRARFDLLEGPSVPQTIAVQFHCNGSTLSKLDFQLSSDMYKLSLVKRKIVTGKYTADPRYDFELQL